MNEKLFSVSVLAYLVLGGFASGPVVLGAGSRVCTSDDARVCAELFATADVLLSAPMTSALCAARLPGTAPVVGCP